MNRVIWCVAAVVAPVPVAAEQRVADASSDDIIVMARKRSEAIDDVPASVQAIPADRIERQHVRSLDELAQLMPNVVLNRRQDNEPNAVIRGVGAFGNVQGIGFYLDDVQNFTDQSAVIADVERIEVLKGPQGTLYGGSNIGGAIRYVLRRPGDRLAAQASAGYGTFDTFETFGAIDAPIAQGLAVRISGHARQTDGYVANTTLGGRADRSHEDGGRVALSWSPAPEASILVQLRHNVLANGGNIYVRVPDARSYRRDVAYNERAFNDRTVTGGSVQGEFRIGGAALTLISAYAHRSNLFRWDVDYSAADAVTLVNGDRHTTRVLTEEARLASATTGPLTWLIGAFYSQVIDRPLTVNTDVLLGRAAGGPRFIKDYTNGTTDERQYAAFGTLGYDPGRWRFELGARLNRVAFEGAVYREPVVRTRVASTIVLPRASIGYDTGSALIYAGLAMGAEPGRANVQSAAATAYGAERATSAEAGVKGNFADGRARYSAALFYTDSRRRQLETLFVNAAGVLTEATTNVGRSISIGAEAGLDVPISNRLDFALAAGWLRARWTDRDARFDLESINGLRIPNAPTATLSFAAGYRQPIDSGLALRLAIDGRFTGRFAWDVLNRSFQTAYTIVNAALSLEPQNSSRWSLMLRMENATGASYFTEFNPDLFGPGQSLGAPARPRAAMATLMFRR